MSEFLPESQMPKEPSFGQVAPTAYGEAQPQQPLHPAPLGVAFTTPASVSERPWIVAALAGVVTGAVAAFVYAAVSFAVGTEILALVMAIGAAVGVVVGKVSRRPGALNGVIAMVIAAPATLAAAVLLVVFTVTDSIPDGLSVLGRVDYAAALHAYFSDALGYVWFGASVVVAFIAARRVSPASK